MARLALAGTETHAIESAYCAVICVIIGIIIIIIVSSSSSSTVVTIIMIISFIIIIIGVWRKVLQRLDT